LLRRHYVNAIKGIYSVRNETASRVLRYARFIQRASATIEAEYAVPIKYSFGKQNCFAWFAPCIVQLPAARC